MNDETNEKDDKQMMSKPKYFVERSTNECGRRAEDEQQTDTENDASDASRGAQHHSNAERVRINTLNRIYLRFGGLQKQQIEHGGKRLILAVDSDESLVVVNMCTDVQQRPETDSIADTTVKANVLIKESNSESTKS